MSPGRGTPTDDACRPPDVRQAFQPDCQVLGSPVTDACHHSESKDCRPIPPGPGEVAATRIALTVTPAMLGSFCLLTGSGFRVRTRLGCSVRELICGGLGIAPEYLEQRIQTIFLNGMVVDDPDTAVVPAGAAVALSAAMPGIAGAVLRKNSRCAPMRSVLSYRGPDGEATPDAEGEVVIKLFNLLQPELGPGLLAHGIRISAHAFHDLLHGRWDAFRAGILDAEISGQAVAPEALLQLADTRREVLLIVHPSAADAPASVPRQ